MSRQNPIRSEGRTALRGCLQSVECTMFPWLFSVPVEVQGLMFEEHDRGILLNMFWNTPMCSPSELRANTNILMRLARQQLFICTGFLAQFLLGEKDRGEKEVLHSVVSSPAFEPAIRSAGTDRVFSGCVQDNSGPVSKAAEEEKAEEAAEKVEEPAKDEL